MKKELLKNLEINYEKNISIYNKLGSSSPIDRRDSSKESLRDIRALKDKLKIEKENIYFNKKLLESMNVKIRTQAEGIEFLENKIFNVKSSIDSINLNKNFDGKYVSENTIFYNNSSNKLDEINEGEELYETNEKELNHEEPDEKLYEIVNQGYNNWKEDKIETKIELAKREMKNLNTLSIKKKGDDKKMKTFYKTTTNMLSIDNDNNIHSEWNDTVRNAQNFIEEDYSNFDFKKKIYKKRTKSGYIAHNARKPFQNFSFEN